MSRKAEFLKLFLLLRDLENPPSFWNFSGVPSLLFTSIGDSYTKEFYCSSCCWTELYKSPFFFHLGSSVTLCNKKWHPGTLRSTASFSRAKVGKRTVASWEDDGIGHRLQTNRFFVKPNKVSEWLRTFFSPLYYYLHSSSFYQGLKSKNQYYRVS